MWKPSPAFIVAMLALFVALAGTADAVVNAAVPLARRALVAENAKKLNGQTAREIATIPGPASTAMGIISIRSKPVLLAPGVPVLWTVECSPNEKVVSGGYASAAVINLLVSRPLNERTWQWAFVNVDNKQATITLGHRITCAGRSASHAAAQRGAQRDFRGCVGEGVRIF